MRSGWMGRGRKKEEMETKGSSIQQLPLRYLESAKGAC